MEMSFPWFLLPPGPRPTQACQVSAGLLLLLLLAWVWVGGGVVLPPTVYPSLAVSPSVSLPTLLDCRLPPAICNLPYLWLAPPFHPCRAVIAGALVDFFFQGR